jgi:hypothetical protein
MDRLGVALPAFSQGQKVMGDACPDGLECHASNFGQDVIEVAGQLLSGGPTDFGMRLPDLVEPNLGEAKDRARGDGLESNWILPAGCTGDPDRTGSVEIGQRQMSTGPIINECSKSSVGDDGKLRIVDELAGWQMKDPR